MGLIHPKICIFDLKVGLSGLKSEIFRFTDPKAVGVVTFSDLKSLFNWRRKTRFGGFFAENAKSAVKGWKGCFPEH
jgi:hypothetical protein